jgi:transposase
MTAPRKYAQELRDRAVRLVLDSDRPIARIAKDLGIHREALRLWVRRAQADAGQRPEQLSTAERDELRRLRKENSELKRAPLDAWPKALFGHHAVTLLSCPVVTQMLSQDALAVSRTSNSASPSDSRPLSSSARR